MKVALVGDIHADYYALRPLNQEGLDLIIQVGDFGFFPQTLPGWEEAGVRVPVMAIAGNHEHFPMLYGYDERGGVYTIRDRLAYVARGTVLTLGSKRVGFMGGASSVDAWRKADEWEHVTEAQVDEMIRCVGDHPLDLLVTHAPPRVMVDQNFPPIDKNWWGLAPDWVDKSGLQIQRLWEALGKPRLVCGHMHRSVEWENCRILNINEYIIEEW